ncbi:MAG: hypothetical protein B7Y56_15270 [Gallionellales bacterium 35-53-114]|jgi:hypothetical protein|nr:MAG: hypothetical protein B7Y56_15270 [Gallionellales bacterium 35-53-114]OYZ63604.1 MAG: hypothetical protein B7Y04_09675 [Gallionellales bacterium 24-53-125]OZB10786.1 MAG: hypothetical protein B7X61_00015 [Gallionellales bacterium 39-52-133]HQS59046.1 DUF3224 domain-containing protein [Gallionellaceae bacterium]HQS75569.1 DUF3224 domain-containing protein [Gallionellaceae bacterium]
MSSIVNCQFVATSWSEVPFHEINGTGKLSRASIRNTLSGGIDAEGVLEYLLAYPSIAGEEVPFIGYERIIGRIETANGSFVIRHDGVFSSTSGVNGKLEIMTGSGTGDFVGITGSGTITAKAGEHGGEYALSIQYPA